MNHCLQVERLRKQISERDLLDCVTCRDQHTQVARQRRRVARNVYLSRSSNFRQQCSDLSPKPGARWIDNNKVGSLTPTTSPQKIEG